MQARAIHSRDYTSQSRRGSPAKHRPSSLLRGRPEATPQNNNMVTSATNYTPKNDSADDEQVHTAYDHGQDSQLGQ